MSFFFGETCRKLLMFETDQFCSGSINNSDLHVLPVARSDPGGAGQVLRVGPERETAPHAALPDLVCQRQLRELFCSVPPPSPTCFHLTLTLAQSERIQTKELIKKNINRKVLQPLLSVV